MHRSKSGQIAWHTLIQVFGGKHLKIVRFVCTIRDGKGARKKMCFTSTRNGYSVDPQKRRFRIPFCDHNSLLGFPF